MDDAEPENNVRIGWGKLSLSAHGPSVIFLFGVLIILASNFYLNDLRKHEHELLLHSHDLMTCVLTLSPEERIEFRRTYRPGAEIVPCPWIRGEH